MTSAGVIPRRQQGSPVRARGSTPGVKTTAESCAKREAVVGAQQKRALAVLTGGRAAS
jgi:hypothetical protein